MLIFAILVISQTALAPEEIEATLENVPAKAQEIWDLYDTTAKTDTDPHLAQIMEDEYANNRNDFILANALQGVEEMDDPAWNEFKDELAAYLGADIHDIINENEFLSLLVCKDMDGSFFDYDSPDERRFKVPLGAEDGEEDCLVPITYNNPVFARRIFDKYATSEDYDAIKLNGLQGISAWQPSSQANSNWANRKNFIAAQFLLTLEEHKTPESSRAEMVPRIIGGTYLYHYVRDNSGLENIEYARISMYLYNLIPDTLGCEQNCRNMDQEMGEFEYYSPSAVDDRVDQRWFIDSCKDGDDRNILVENTCDSCLFTVEEVDCSELSEEGVCAEVYVPQISTKSSACFRDLSPYFEVEYSPETGRPSTTFEISISQLGTPSGISEVELVKAHVYYRGIAADRITHQFTDEIELVKEEDTWVGTWDSTEKLAGIYVVKHIFADYSDEPKLGIITPNEERQMYVLNSGYKVMYVPVDWEFTNQRFIDIANDFYNNYFKTKFPLRDCLDKVQAVIVPPDVLNCNVGVSMNRPVASIQSFKQCIEDNQGIIEGFDTDYNAAVGIISEREIPDSTSWGFGVLGNREVFNIYLAPDTHLHEIGHSHGLKEEYAYGCINCGEPNPLHADYGCDPSEGGGCCVYDEPIGTCFADNPDHVAACEECPKESGCRAGCTLAIADRTIAKSEWERLIEEEKYPVTGRCQWQTVSPYYLSLNPDTKYCFGNLNADDPDGIGRGTMGGGANIGPKGFSEPAMEHLSQHPELRCDLI